MAVVVSSISPATLEGAGGALLSIVGTFNPALESQVVIVNGDDDEFPCYSARCGQGYDPIPKSTTLLLVAIPPLPSGTYSVKVTQGVANDTLEDALTIVASNGMSSVFALRRILPPRWNVGPRTFAQTE